MPEDEHWLLRPSKRNSALRQKKQDHGEQEKPEALWRDESAAAQSQGL
jgi:hypothetical protein